MGERDRGGVVGEVVDKDGSSPYGHETRSRLWSLVDPLTPNTTSPILCETYNGDLISVSTGNFFLQFDSVLFRQTQ